MDTVKNAPSALAIIRAPEHDALLPTLRSKAAVRVFARKIDLHSGIVAGRLPHDLLIEPSWFNDLKASFRFKATP